MAQYWRSHLALNNSLVQRFFERAPAHARAHAMKYLGRSLFAAKGEVTARILKRLIALWETRRAVAAGNIDQHRGELEAFGWWFAAGKLDPAWALEQLLEVLQLVHAVDLDTHVLEHLAALTPAHPLLAMECLRALIAAGPPWLILGAEGQVGNILAAALKSDNAAAHENATRLIHELGVRGHTTFRTHLRSTT